MKPFQSLNNQHADEANKREEEEREFGPCSRNKGKRCSHDVCAVIQMEKEKDRLLFHCSYIEGTFCDEIVCFENASQHMKKSDRFECLFAKDIFNCDHAQCNKKRWRQVLHCRFITGENCAHQSCFSSISAFMREKIQHMKSDERVKCLLEGGDVCGHGSCILSRSVNIIASSFISCQSSTLRRCLHGGCFLSLSKPAIMGRKVRKIQCVERKKRNVQKKLFTAENARHEWEVMERNYNSYNEKVRQEEVRRKCQSAALSRVKKPEEGEKDRERRLSEEREALKKLLRDAQPELKQRSERWRQSLISTVNESETTHEDDIIIGYGRKRKRKVKPKTPTMQKDGQSHPEKNKQKTPQADARRQNTPSPQPDLNACHTPPPQAGTSRCRTPSPQPGPSGLQRRSPPRPPPLPPSRKSSNKSSKKGRNVGKNNTSQIFTCPTCKHVTTRWFNYKRHMLTIHDVDVGAREKKKIKCSNCPEEFVNRTMLEKHTVDAHTLRIGRKCLDCGIILETTEDLQRHINEKHDLQSGFKLVNTAFRQATG